MDEARKQRAIDGVTKYRETLKSPERIAAFAVWFAEAEFGWKGRTETAADRHDALPTERYQAQCSSAGIPHKWRRLVCHRSNNAFCAPSVGTHSIGSPTFRHDP